MYVQSYAYTLRYMLLNSMDSKGCIEVYCAHHKYCRKLAGNIVTLKRFSIKLTTILVGYPLTFRQLA